MRDRRITPAPTQVTGDIRTDEAIVEPVGSATTVLVERLRDALVMPSQVTEER